MLVVINPLMDAREIPFVRFAPGNGFSVQDSKTKGCHFPELQLAVADYNQAVTRRVINAGGKNAFPQWDQNHLSIDQLPGYGDALRDFERWSYGQKGITPLKEPQPLTITVSGPTGSGKQEALQQIFNTLSNLRFYGFAAKPLKRKILIREAAPDGGGWISELVLPDIEEPTPQDVPGVDYVTPQGTMRATESPALHVQKVGRSQRQNPDVAALVAILNAKEAATKAGDQGKAVFWDSLATLANHPRTSIKTDKTSYEQLPPMPGAQSVSPEAKPPAPVKVSKLPPNAPGLMLLLAILAAIGSKD